MVRFEYRNPQWTVGFGGGEETGWEGFVIWGTYDYKDKSLAGTQFPASIHLTIYDARGMPCSGECVANYLDGKWIYT